MSRTELLSTCSSALVKRCRSAPGSMALSSRGHVSLARFSRRRAAARSSRSWAAPPGGAPRPAPAARGGP
ncbi:hypothetical protein VTK73DRAFT_3934 [Phialemonium thermophilum]|uniref:Uncharacterized protein n=1 Tax=Phialemonium thermophilum TaxID=223376 RepID=A0ABR3VD03_9PEZI